VKKGRCPKCQSTEIFVNLEGGLHHRGECYREQVIAKDDLNLETYLCMACGYVELYAAAQTDARRPKPRLEVLPGKYGWQPLSGQGGPGPAPG